MERNENLLILNHIWKKQQTAKVKESCWVPGLHQERPQKGEFEITENEIHINGPQQDCGSAEAKKVLDALENDKKANFQGNIPGKVQFWKQ